MSKYLVWLDDWRWPTVEFARLADIPIIWCRHVHEVVPFLKRREVAYLSLDHDLGEDKKTGYHLCLWMAKTGKWPTNKPLVHSQNPIGAEAMRFVIDRYYPKGD